ncbi:RDD family protein [Vibrio sp. WXL103]|uniref:RDD family protein n=1 Tax=Vibrio sp. WXL103 TaxID=3450710 RepID=UPI003EC869C3
MNTIKDYPTAGLMRRFAALFYDALIIIAIEMIAAGLIVALLMAGISLGVISYGHYIDAGDLLSNHPIWSPLFALYLATVWVGFFSFFWIKAGQTLGMRAWRLQLVNHDGGKITLTQALIRIATSAFGLANLTVPLDPQKRGFHDMWAKTKVVVLPNTK